MEKIIVSSLQSQEIEIIAISDVSQKMIADLSASVLHCCIRSKWFI